MAAAFHLQIVSLDGLIFDGRVQSVSCRTIHGDLALLARHINYCTAIAMGRAEVVFEDGSRRRAACIGGMLSMMNGECRLLATTWEWSEEIDVARAHAAKERAGRILESSGHTDQELRLAEAKLHRALVRIGAAERENV